MHRQPHSASLASHDDPWLLELTLVEYVDGDRRLLTCSPKSRTPIEVVNLDLRYLFLIWDIIWDMWHTVDWGHCDNPQELVRMETGFDNE